jgi:hypothetical protein
MKRLILLVVIVVIGVKWLESNPFTQSATTYNEPGLGEVNQSQAALNYAQAAKVNQEVQDTREAKDGYAVNVVARVVMGRGLTDAEQLGTTGLIFGAILCLLPWLALGLLYVLWKLTRPMVVTHE